MLWLQYLPAVLVAAFSADILVRISKKIVASKLGETDKERLKSLSKRASDLSKKELTEYTELQKRQTVTSLLVSVPTIGVFFVLKNYIKEHLVYHAGTFIIVYSLTKLAITMINGFLIQQIVNVM